MPAVLVGTFTNIYYGSKLLDNSQRNGFTWDAGGMASLTALTHVTITGRLYLDVWSDRHCPTQKATPVNPGSDIFEGDGADAATNPSDRSEIQVCRDFYLGAANKSDPEIMRVTQLTGWTQPDDVFGREDGIRLMASIIAEIAFDQHWNIFGLLEGAPFQGERALFTNLFTKSMFDTDYNFYARVGLTYKF